LEWLTVEVKKGILLPMSQLPLFKPSSWTVTDLTKIVRQLLEGDPRLGDVWVVGEVSNCQQAGSGHLYFTLKDRSASLRCVMWRNSVLRQDFIPTEGDAVEVHGAIGVYEVAGAYQLYADQILPAGEGILYQEFLRLKERLEAEGLFDLSRKRPIPRWPVRIGVVTSPTGAALRDILNTIRRRCPAVEVILAPTPVQGDEAPAGIIAALRELELAAEPDVIIVARGGGSIEDLWAFNDEDVARAIARTQAPVISGVGHETDFTIADFVADLRAPTPTAAAELATPDQDEARSELEALKRRLSMSAQAALMTPRLDLSDLLKRLQLQSPQARLRSDRQRLDELARRSEIALEHALHLKSAHLSGLRYRLASLDPNAVMNRGYAIILAEDGRVIKSITEVEVGDHLGVKVSDGQFKARVINGKAES
jgi:exodeoxyribonuclease VII large subunit